MEATKTKRPRITKERILRFTTDMTRVCNRLDKRIDQAIEENRQARKELFPEPYKDWRTNEITK